MNRFKNRKQRTSLYRNFRFRVCWEGAGIPVAGFTKVSALTQTNEVVGHREWDEVIGARKIRGYSMHQPVMLERGVTYDQEFGQWANGSWDQASDSGSEISLEDYRRNILIEIYSEAGQLVQRYKLYRCWVSELQALPELKANDDTITIHSLRVENEGFELGCEVIEPLDSS